VTNKLISDLAKKWYEHESKMNVRMTYIPSIEVHEENLLLIDQRINK